jgi:hypothetical protein
MAAGFGAAEWLFGRRPRAALADALVRAAVLGLVLSVALGIGLQGRALVASQALQPTLAAGEDPTWTFFLRSTGVFTEPEPEPPARPIAGGVSFPWDTLRVTSAFGWWVLATIAVGMFLLAALGGRKGRAGVVGFGLAGVLLTAAIAFFAVAFETYVPRWTGLVRFGQYVPFGVALGLAFAIEGFLRAWSRLAERRLPRLAPLVVGLVGVVWLAGWVTPRYLSEPRILPAGLEALAELRRVAAPGDVVVSNVLTSGTVELFTGLEAPLEARQPLIEEPGFLAAANDLLLAGHRFFDGGRDRTFVDGLGARWVLVAESPGVLGASVPLGSGVNATTLDWLRTVWRGEGIALYEVMSPATGNARVDRLQPQPLVVPAALALIGFIAIAALLVRTPFAGFARLRPAAARWRPAGR